MVHTDHLDAQTSSELKDPEQIRLKRFFLVQLALILLGVFIYLVLDGKYGAASFFLGGVTSLVNSFFLGLAWSLILKKKLVALGLPTIVIKYAILGIIVYWSMGLPWLQTVAFILGVGTLLPAALAMKLFFKS